VRGITRSVVGAASAIAKSPVTSPAARKGVDQTEGGLQGRAAGSRARRAGGRRAPGCPEAIECSLERLELGGVPAPARRGHDDDLVASLEEAVDDAAHERLAGELEQRFRPSDPARAAPREDDPGPPGSCRRGSHGTARLERVEVRQAQESLPACLDVGG